MSLEKRIQLLQEQFNKELQTITTLDALEQFRITYLGRQGSFAELMNALKELSLDEKRFMGPALNTFKKHAEESFYQQNQI